MSLLAITPRETRFDVRGFHPGSPTAVRALEEHGASFVKGYNTALEVGPTEDLTASIDGLSAAERGFAYEGAAMALALLDLLPTIGRGRLGLFLRGPARPHVYMVHVGAGWALARLRLRPRRRLPALDPFLRWLALDGYGFHEAFFHSRRAVTRHEVPYRLRGYERRAFDQGVGRALWFVDGADIDRTADTLRHFPTARHPDLWSGLALAASYTAAARVEDLRRLRTLGAGYEAQLAQGAAFAVAARDRAGNMITTTRTAAAILCDADVEEIVAVVREARRGLAADPGGNGYECWRARIGQGMLALRGSLTV